MSIPFFFGLFRAAPKAYGGSQARGRIRAVTTGLHHSHSNVRSEARLQPTPQVNELNLNSLGEAGDGTRVHVDASWVR